MTEAGWFADPDDATQLRWWDGTAWTEHRAPSGVEVAPEVLAHLLPGHGTKRELVATTDRLVIDGQVFLLDDLTTVQWRAIRENLNGAYLGTSFTIRVRAGDRVGDYGMNPGSKDIRLDELADAYARVVGLLDAVVCPRLAAAMAAELRAGHTITLGPAGARVELTIEGFRLKKPWSKPVPWDRVVGCELDGGRVYFLLRKGDGPEVKRHSAVPLEGDNILVLPHLRRLLASERA